MFPRDTVRLRNMSINTLHKGDDDDDNNNNNNNNRENPYRKMKKQNIAWAVN